MPWRVNINIDANQRDKMKDDLLKLMDVTFDMIISELSKRGFTDKESNPKIIYELRTVQVKIREIANRDKFNKGFNRGE